MSNTTLQLNDTSNATLTLNNTLLWLTRLGGLSSFVVDHDFQPWQMASWSSMLFLALPAILSLLFLKALYTAHFGPLAHIPGPVMCKWSVMPMNYHLLKGDGMFWQHGLHKKYGPVVRMGPNDVAIANPKDVRAVHAIGSGYRKSPFYTALVAENLPFWFDPLRKLPASTPPMFGIINPKEHAEIRKIQSHPFSKKGIANWEDVVRDNVALCMRQMGKLAADGKADIFTWFGLMSSDTISKIAFGISFNGLQTGKPGAYLVDIRRTLFVNNLFVYLPKPIAFIIKNVPIPTMRHFVGTSYRIRKQGRELIAAYRTQEAAGKGLPNGTIFDHFASEEGGKLVMNESQREAEGRSLLIAGTDTTSITLTYIVWAVLKNDRVRQNILKELGERGLTQLDEMDSFSVGFDQASGMPYVNAVVQEGLRLYGAAMGRLPRVVPSGGDVLSDVHLPGGAVVNPEAFTVHRDPEAYPDAESFDPDRWLKPTDAMKNAFIPFGGGTRICIGMHLAHYQMLLGLIAFFSAYPDARIAAETTDDDMKQVQYFVNAPKGGKCIVELHPKKI